MRGASRTAILIATRTRRKKFRRYYVHVVIEERKIVNSEFQNDFCASRPEIQVVEADTDLGLYRATSATDVTRVILIEGTIARDTPVREEEKARNQSHEPDRRDLFGPFSNGLCDPVEHVRH